MNRIMKSLIQKLVNWAALRGIIADGIHRTAADIIDTLSSATTGPLSTAEIVPRSQHWATASEVIRPREYSLQWAVPMSQELQRDAMQDSMRAWEQAIRRHPLSSITTSNNQIPNPNDTPRDEVIVRPLP
jgi:hypothetical protein